ncbi:FecR domain-containing protein [Fibrobacterota bacterium]
MAFLRNFLIFAVLAYLPISGASGSGGEFLKPRVKEVSGRVEIFESKSMEWRMVRDGEFCGNNDKINVHKGGHLILSYPDGSEIILREATKILLNSSKKTLHGNANKIITVFQGAVYFMARKPFHDYEGHLNRIYSPTAVFSTKSGSFLVELDDDSENSRIFILRGTLEIRNIKGAGNIYLKEGWQIKTDSTGQLTEPEELMDDEFIAEFAWLDKETIEEELLLGRLVRKREQDVISGKSKGKIILMNLDYRDKEHRNWDIDNFVTRFIAEQFSRVTHREVVIAGMAGKDNPVAFGLAQEADRVVTGKINAFRLTNKAVLSDDETKYELDLAFKLNVLIQIIDPLTEEVVKQVVFSGEWTGKRSPENDLQKITKQPLDDENRIIQKSLLGKVLNSFKSNLKKFGRSAL